LGGAWLGNPLHPALTDVPAGAWTAAFLLDAVGILGALGAMRPVSTTGAL
jgi:hypothetical protein